jgi:predicted metal-dependent hydrolase
MSVNDVLTSACRTSPPPSLVEAAQLYRRGSYFVCHEVLEELWRETEGPLREFYRGLIQVVVGLYHARRGNFVGGRNVLARGLARIERYPSPCAGMDVARFCEGARRYLHWIENGAAGGEPEPPPWCWVVSSQDE